MITDNSISLLQVLEKTVSTDQNELEATRQYLENQGRQNLLVFVRKLSDVLRNVDNSQVARMAAGLQLKNNLTSKDEALRAEFARRWLQFPREERNHIKRNVLEAIGTESMRPSTAAQCVAYIAVVELPADQWPELMAALLSNVTAEHTTETVKVATLETIGYICQDIDEDYLDTRSNSILTAIVHGMRREESSEHVRLAATKALLNSLDYAGANFEKDEERHFIMRVICEATQSSNTQIKVAALQCLSKTVSVYYHHMESYMAQTLFPITMEAMKSEIDEIKLQGIDFWMNVCDEEIDLASETREAAEMGRPPPNRTSKFYAKGALKFVVPVLLETLTGQEECAEEDDWRPFTAADLCLTLLATCCGNDVVPHVLDFIRNNIKNPDWRHRAAAVTTFASILEGPDPNIIKTLVEEALPMLIDMMADRSALVRDATVMSVCRVCELFADEALCAAHLGRLLQSLLQCLSAEPRPAANACWAITNLAEAAYDTAYMTEEGYGEPETYCLSPYFEHMVHKLLETTDRADGVLENVQTAAYESLMEMVKNSAKDCYMTVRNTTTVILAKLQRVLQIEAQIQNPRDRLQYNDLLSQLCATLQCGLMKMTPEDALQISDAIMMALLQILSSEATRSGGLMDDVLMPVSTLTEVLGESFAKYMDAFKPFLYLGLRNFAETQTCIAAVGVTGDICSGLGLRILPYLDEIMPILLENLNNNAVHRSVKPHILLVFRDIVVSVGNHFLKYLDVVLQALMQASHVQVVDRSNYEVIDWLNELRESCLETYSGIIQGLRGDVRAPPGPDVMRLEPQVPVMMNLITSVAQDPERSDGCLAYSAGLIGDLCSIFGLNMLPLVSQDAIMDLLQEGRRSTTPKTNTVANCVLLEIYKLKDAVTAVRR